MLLWILPAQDSTHDLRNANQMANKTNTYWKDRPERSLPPDTRKRDNRINMHLNSKKIDFLCLRLPFGTTPAPSEYTTVSEASIDLGNNLLRDES